MASGVAVPVPLLVRGDQAVVHRFSEEGVCHLLAATPVLADHESRPFVIHDATTEFSGSSSLLLVGERPLSSGSLPAPIRQNSVLGSDSESHLMPQVAMGARPQVGVSALCQPRGDLSPAGEPQLGEDVLDVRLNRTA